MQRLSLALTSSLCRPVQGRFTASVGRRLVRSGQRPAGQASASAAAAAAKVAATAAEQDPPTGANLLKLFLRSTLLYTAADTLALAAAAPPVGLVSPSSPALISGAWQAALDLR